MRSFNEGFEWSGAVGIRLEQRGIMVSENGRFGWGF